MSATLAIGRENHRQLLVEKQPKQRPEMLVQDAVHRVAERPHR